MPDEFSYDVFLSHSTKDKAPVRTLAERLRADGVKVWFDEWAFEPGGSIPARTAKIEEALERARVLVLCMSANAFGSDWVQLEFDTLRFRDPLNKGRRLLLLRLDDTPIKGPLAQTLHINWLPAFREQEYPKLLETCRRSPKLPAKAGVAGEQIAKKAIQLEYRPADVRAYTFSPDGQRALTASGDKTVRLWDTQTGHYLRVMKGHTGEVYDVAWSSNQRRALSASQDKTVRLWDVETGKCVRVFKGHEGVVVSVAWSPDLRHALSASYDKSLRLWDVQTGRCVRVFEGHTNGVENVVWMYNRPLLCPLRTMTPSSCGMLRKVFLCAP